MNLSIVTALLIGTTSAFVSNTWEKNPRLLVKNSIYFSSKFESASDHPALAILAKHENWKEEALTAALNEREPSYLPKISDNLGEQLKLFNRNKLETLQTKENLSKHAYTLLFTMRAFKSVFVYPAADSIANAAADAAAKIAANAAADPNNFPRLRQDSYANRQHAAKLGATINAARHTSQEIARKLAWKSAWVAARNAAWYPAWEAAWEAVEEAACEPAGQAAWEAAGEAIWELLGNATWDAVCEDTWEGKTPIEIGRIAFREAEKASSFYFLQKFDYVLGKTYGASMEKLTDCPKENIFDSLESWNSFKAKHFGNLNKQSVHFVQPWLDELDSVVDKIELLEQ